MTTRCYLCAHRQGGQASEWAAQGIGGVPISENTEETWH